MRISIEDLEKLDKWVKEGNGNRTAEIRLGDYANKNYFHIRVYDYELEVSQYVNSPDEIDIGKAVHQKYLEMKKTIKELVKNIGGQND